MCRGKTFPLWEAEAIRNVLAVPGVELAVLIVDMNNKPVDSSVKTASDVKIREGLAKAYREGTILTKTVGRTRECINHYILLRGESLWPIYRSMSLRRGMPCMTPVDLSRELQGVPEVFCRTEQHERFSQYFSSRDVSAIRSFEPDVVLCFGFNIIRGEILSVPRYGVWLFHHEDHLKCRGVPPGFWEIYYGDEWTGSMLQRLTNKLDDRVIVRKEFFKTQLHSYGRNLNQILMASAKWPAIACEALQQGLGERIFFKDASSRAPIYNRPTDFQMLRYFPRLAKNILAKHYDDVFGESPVGKDNWAIGIIKDERANLIAWNRPLEVTWLMPPEGRFYADPFVIRKDESCYIFFEDFDYATRKARISLVETDNCVNFSKPRVVLEQPYHLSYPYVFGHEGRYYCAPEQYQSGEVALYEAKNFPEGWVKRTVLVSDFPGVDPTLFHHDDRWWLFLTRQDADPWSNLYVFYSDHLLGSWKAHAQNPVKHSRLKARPGGCPFVVDGALLRPVQNCSRTYGGSLMLCRITSLSEDRFAEEVVAELEPKAEWPYSAGMHTISAAGDVTVIDAKRFLPVRNNTREVLAAKLRSAVGRLHTSRKMEQKRRVTNQY